MRFLRGGHVVYTPSDSPSYRRLLDAQREASERSQRIAQAIWDACRERSERLHGRPRGESGRAREVTGR